MLYSDPAGTVESILYDGSTTADASVTDEYGVLHRLWRISDPAAIKLLVSAMADKKLIIADGHHRYETALNYSKEHAIGSVSGASGKAESSLNQLPHPSRPEAAVMMTFVNMDSEGLVILPTHRVIHSLPGFVPSEFAKAAEAYFMITPLQAQSVTSWLELLRGQQGTAFVAVTHEGAWLLQALPAVVAAALAETPERQRRLDLTQLHALVLERLLGLGAEKVREQTNIRYLRDAGEAVDQVRRGEADIAFLTNPVALEQLKEVAFAGEVMPQKSTDFYPKLLSGLTIYALD
jgi:uncharacterized protein (DUF1015 family)